MLIILLPSVLLTSLLSGVFGMAGGMLLMGMLLVLFSVEKAMFVHGVAQFASNGWRAVLWWRYISWRVFRGYALGAALVMTVATTAQVTPSRPVVMLMLGAAPFVAFMLPSRLQLNVERKGHPFVCGSTCMAIQMFSGVSGPLLDTFFVRSAMDRRQVVSTKAAVQTLSHALRMAFFGWVIAVAESPISTSQAVLVVVCAIAGTSASKLILDRITDVNFRLVTQHLVLVLGAGYCAAGGWLLF
ncbi:TSUP family transporter [Hydrogenophaga sp.]|uniref:TSUP family transporter n=1 Tax=Hydrogenophaga sp. TaxID=1904254 RepID=UPI003F7224D8